MTFRATIFTNIVRYYSTPKGWKPDGVKYGHITYYPRNPDYVDPSFTPSKLLMVKRVKSIRYNPYWEQDILTKNLGFKEKNRDPVIVKNTPEICAMLWKVKHLVKITPIKLPDKLPTEDDLNGTYLHENGNFYITPKVDPVRYEATVQFENNPKKLNHDIIQDKLRLKWLEGRTM